MKIFKIITCLVISCALAACVLSACGNKKDGGGESEPDEVTYSDDPMFDAENWVYMTNGNNKDSGGTAYSLNDGTVKFHNANQAYDCGKDYSNGSIEFMLKGSSNWQIWLLANTVDNTNVNCYKLIYMDGLLYLTTSRSQNMLASADKDEAGYEVNEWNKLNISFSTTADDVCTVTLKINGGRVVFNNAQSGEYVDGDGNFTYTQSESFVTGNYMVAKVWYGDCFLQLRSVDDDGKPEVKKIACIGDSITYGANADDAYTDSYPAQLQKLLGGDYNVMNFGKSGATLRDSADDPYRSTPEYRGAMLFKPDIALVMLGTNDSKTYQTPTVATMKAAFDVLLNDLYELNEDMEIYIATSPYAYSTAYSINNGNIENYVIPAQRETAEYYGLEIIEMHEYTKNMNGNYADGIHPTTKGYTYLAYCFYCVLTDTEQDAEYAQSFKD